MRTGMGIAIFVLLMLFMSSEASPSLEWKGYYENQFSLQGIKSITYLSDYNRVRLDLSKRFGERVFVSGDYIYQNYWGKNTFNFLDFMPGAYLNLVTGSARAAFDYTLADEGYLDNAYAAFYLPRVDIKAGKQLIAWGTGYAWNPTDIFTKKDILDPTYERRGVEAVRLDIPFRAAGGLTAVISPISNSNTKAVRLKDNYFNFDFSISFVEMDWTSLDYLTSTSLTELRRIYGADFSGELWGIGVWGEGAKNIMEISADYSQYLLGLNYTFTSGTYVMTEYYRNNRGKGSQQDYTFNQWIELLTLRENLGREYVMLGVSHPASELLELKAFSLVNLSDQSYILMPGIDYNFMENLDIIFQANLFQGGTGSEFGEFGQGGFLRLRYYF